MTFRENFHEKNLGALIEALPPTIKADLCCTNLHHNQMVSKISSSSASLGNDSMFVAVPGATCTSRDGHEFLTEALAQGAKCVVINHDHQTATRPYPPEISIIKCSDTKTLLCHLAEAFYDHPAKRLKIIGITGTNGKTSTTFMLHSIFKAANLKPQIMGTLGFGDPENLTPLSHTTMEPHLLSEHLALMCQKKASHVFMEISSHALALKRVEALNFEATALTNITQDHLDFHETWANYSAAKGRLFFELGQGAVKVLPKYHPWPEAKLDELHLYDEETAGIRSEYDNIQVQHEQKLIALPFYGAFHAKNAALAITLAKLLHIDQRTIIKGLMQCSPIPGRLQPVPNTLGLRVIVDYAHTPDALKLLLKSVRKFTRGRLILVFGCGGDRDQKKRPPMGAIASALADLIIVTDDNPRSEDPGSIREQILTGMDDLAKVLNIGDRHEALGHALKLLRHNDTLVVAGKGHENYQIYGEQRREFSDYLELKILLDQL